VAQYAELNVESFPRHELSVRNRREALTIHIIKDVRALAEQSEKERTLQGKPHA